MKDLLLFVDARLGEASTWSSLAVMLMAAHINIDPGVWREIMLWGLGFAAVLGVVLKEGGAVASSQLAVDGLAALTNATASAGSIAGTTVKVTGLLALMVGGLLSACSATSSTASPSPLVTVMAAESGLAIAGHAALVYLDLPSCTGSNGPLCSTPTIKAQIQGYYDQAYAAVTAAQATADGGGSPDMTAATAALTVLQNAITGLPKAS